MKQTIFYRKPAIFGGVLFLLLLASVSDARRTRATAEVEPEPETTPLNRKQTVALHHAVKKLLGLKVSPHKLEEGSRGGGGHLGRKSNSLVGSPPQYMLDLYDKYKYGAIPHGRLTGNTVRYIDAEIGVVDGERVFVFNLSSVAPTERVFSADLHLYQRRTSKHADHLVALRKVTPKVISNVGSVPLRSRDKGWQAADVTSGVKRCISSNRKSAVTSSLTVSFRRKKGGKKSRVVPISRFSGETSLPFLVLFSNDTQNITLDHVDPHFRSADLLEEVVDPEFGYDPTLVDGKYQRKLVPEVDDLEYDEDYSEEEEESTEDDLDDIFTFDGFSEETEDEELEDTDTEVRPTDRARPSPGTEGQSAGRTRRSIHDNEIPETPGLRLPLKPPYNMPPPDGVTFTTRSKGPEGGHTVKVKDNKVKVDPTPGTEVKEDKEWTPPKSVTTSVSTPDDKKEPDADADLIPYPDEFVERRRKNRRRNRRRNRKHGRRRRPHHHERQLPLPPAWEAELRKENLTGGDRKGLCGRRKLVVDFADIGWNDWIISPKSFEAHYCAGQCPFPLVKDVRPSNHATIQSLVHVIGIPADVPAPCCVPDELTAVSLLYFDGNKNVVLKHYPSMSVTSCACR